MTEHAQRRKQLADNLGVLRHRIARACDESGRDPDEVTVIAVTKTFPASDIALLAELGIRDIGENRDQEARTKVRQLTDNHTSLRWHFVGQLQRNKVPSVVSYSTVIHSVDRPELVTALASAVQSRQSSLDVLIQVNLDPDAERDQGPSQRGGVPPSEVNTLAELMSNTPGLKLKGVMAIAPLTAPARPAFERLQVVSSQLRASYQDAGWISAGMSHDLEDALICGATHLRVGSALLGHRS